MPNIKPLAPWQMAAIFNPYQHFGMFAGVGAGKTFTGSHFSLYHIHNYPDMTGLIGANTHDQLSQATLKDFLEQLNDYDMPFVVGAQPPKEWGCERNLKDYRNSMHVHNPITRKTTTIFLRVTSEPNNLRGISLSWYWLDETRDTKVRAHDVILSRMRETPGYIKGLITSTTAGEDWAWQRFVKDGNANKMFGSMHVPTMAAVKAGFISQEFYDIMRATYSELLAMQELDALHVNAYGGKAYYAASHLNRSVMAPWGDLVPSRERPLIVGCDFNFSPAPMVWVVGQLGPPLYSPEGHLYSDCIHWFTELSGKQISTSDMTLKLLSQYPDFYYQIYGDTSGGIGTTSNAGTSDYDQMSMVLSDAEAEFGIDYLQLSEDEARRNPRVKARVENMNRLLKNAVGEIRMTYNPAQCPYFDGDMKQVGWKPETSSGRGKLDGGGNVDRTHASDGAGYAAFKIFPPGMKARLIESLPSQIRGDYGLMSERNVRSW